MKTRIALLFGGRSVEHEVSVISGLQAYNNIDRDKYDVTPVYMTKDGLFFVGDDVGKIESYRNIPGLLKGSHQVIWVNDGNGTVLKQYPAPKLGKGIFVPVDLAFPVVHGTNVEDGALQGFLKTIGVPFVGCDVCASAIGMDKYVQKTVLRDNDIPVLEATVYTLSDYEEMDGLIGRIEETYGYPVIIKPVNLGSSVGISVAHDRNELTSSIDDAYRYASVILAERAIANLREINCSVLGDENHAEASECEEPMHTEDILSYKDKYVSGSKGGKSSGMASVSRRIPADIPDEMRTRIRDLAVRAFKALRCNGVARMDFMIDTDNDRLYFNEINTIPGSLAFYLWEPLGKPYKQLLTDMIELARARARNEGALTFTFDTNILNNASIGGSKGRKQS
ncbi:MAG: D-alanine--D-alanine ligase [Lachnospiraceae bacterium]|nr:D-alanine--D-alanine ligase [Lachnospiraceae bacterium]